MESKQMTVYYVFSVHCIQLYNVYIDAINKKNDIHRKQDHNRIKGSGYKVVGCAAVLVWWYRFLSDRIMLE